MALPALQPCGGCAAVVRAASRPRGGSAWHRVGEHTLDLGHGVRTQSNIFFSILGEL